MSKRTTWHKFKRNKGALIGLGFIAFVALIAILGPFIRPDSSPGTNEQHLAIAKQKPGFTAQVLEVPRENYESGSFWGKITNYGWVSEIQEIPLDSLSANGLIAYPAGGGESISVSESQVKIKTYLLGTDKYGRDMLSRIMGGAIISLAVGVIAVLISLLVGLILGTLAGYYRGRVDQVTMWLINVVWSIPTLLLVMAIVFAFGKGFEKVFIAVGLTMWVEVARVVRGQILSVREKEYVEAARALGFSDLRIMFKHILPNVINPVIVISAANFSAAILIEAGLSFLGIGAQIPTPSWGNLIKEHYAFITTDSAYLALLPGVAIMLLVLSFMLVGNGLRDALDVKSM